MQLWLNFTLLFFVLLNWRYAQAAINSAHLPLEARDDSGSQEEDIISTSYVLPNQIFNDGKPYYASKDPISGQLDFNAKKPAGIEPAANEVIDPKEKIVLSNTSPNIHDYLNLPVKYSSSKFVYPLVSSSYANLKYQGSNKNYITNKKPTSVEATAVTPTPEYNHQNQYTIPTTKLMAVPSLAPTVITTPTTTTTAAVATAASKKPATTTTMITTPVTHPTSTSIKTSIATSTSIFTPPKYATVSRKPIPIVSTTSPPKPTTTTTTRKKFSPSKKYTPTSPTAPTTTTPLRFPDQKPLNSTAAPHSTPKITTTSTTYTTKQPTKQASIFPTESSSTSTTKLDTSNTKRPVKFTENQSLPISTQSIPSGSTTRVPNLDPADVYQTLGQKNTLKDVEQKPAMTLADIFNSLAEEEFAVASNNQGNPGFDAQGNLMQPFAPSKPSPFAMQGPHNNRPTSARPTQNTPPGPQQNSQNQQPSQQQQQLFNNDQKVLSGSQENYSNEYVSYQVQQPNVMQYRPAPGAINNVVISPGQNSASFVLGSQQQVGLNAFGTVEKESVFGKERPVQYGTVINELPPQKTGNFPQQPPTQSLQNGVNLRGQEEPPAPPSPYQQLPLIGGPNIRTHTAKPQQGSHQTTQNSIHSDASQPTSNFPQPPKNVVTSSIDPNQSDTKDLLVQSNIRFPINEEQSEEQLSGPVAAGPPAGPQVNGHAQPLSLQQIQQSSTVVFPKTKDEEQNQVQFQSPIGAQDIQIQQHEVVTMNQHKQKLSFPQSPEQHTPSTHMEPPPPPPPSNNEYTDLTKRPHLNRPHGPPPPFSYNEYTRKPIPGITRPNTDRHLPNILPQFRPNAKISSGHPTPNFNQEPGNIRIPPGPGSPKRTGPNLASPQFAHRRQPLMQQPRYPAHRATDYPTGLSGMAHPNDANRRIYRLPPYGGQGFQYVDRMHGRPPMPYPAYRPHVLERHAPHEEPEVYKTLTKHDLDVLPERMAAFEEEDLVINDPPQPVTPSKDRKSIDESKLEPVVTLQMLQSQKKPLSLPNDDTGSGEIQVPSEPENIEDNLEKPSSQNGLYVVYPMTAKNTETSDATSLKDVTPAIAHVESATHSEYQNTPFSVVRDQPQEPILTVKNKKPQSLQQQTKTQPLKDKFPYPIEKPDPSYTELNVQNRVPGVLIAPRIVHGIYSTGTETPIAYAYTPTEPSTYKKHNQKYSNINLASSVIGEIRTESQTEVGIGNDFDLREQNFEKNFMAPFYPSVSLGTVTSAPANGWNILPSSTDSDIYDKNKINRADIDSNVNGEGTDNQNNNFETDHFQPELQGGFKPIYPPGYKADDNYESANQQEHEANDRPLALASRMETTPRTTTSTTTAIPFTTLTTITTTTTTTTSSTTPKPLITTTPSSATKTETPIEKSTTASISKLASNQQTSETTTKAPKTTPTPTQRKKTPFETSLEALLFGDDADFDNEGRKQKEQTQKNPRMAPRSGPRNLKLS